MDSPIASVDKAEVIVTSIVDERVVQGKHVSMPFNGWELIFRASHDQHLGYKRRGVFFDVNVLSVVAARFENWIHFDDIAIYVPVSELPFNRRECG